MSLGPWATSEEAAPRPINQSIMASKVIESWKRVTAIENYEAVAGKILFTRYVTYKSERERSYKT